MEANSRKGCSLKSTMLMSDASECCRSVRWNWCEPRLLLIGQSRELPRPMEWRYHDNRREFGRAGDAAGYFNVHRADNGKKLWSLLAQSGIIGAPWGGVYPLSTGSAAADSGNLRNVSRILAFKLGGTATLPPIQKTTFVLSPPPEPRNAGRCWICSYAVDRESDALKVKTDRRCQPASLHLAGIVAMDYPRTRGGRNT
jgi:hypothetical protein